MQREAVIGAARRGWYPRGPQPSTERVLQVVDAQMLEPPKASLPKRSLYFLAARLRPFCHAVLFIQSSFLPRTESSVDDLAEDFLLDDPAAVLVCGDSLGAWRGS